jgi:hypothetical protein
MLNYAARELEERVFPAAIEGTITFTPFIENLSYTMNSMPLLNASLSISGEKARGAQKTGLGFEQL